jgi:hypothetical protein
VNGWSIFYSGQTSSLCSELWPPDFATILYVSLAANVIAFIGGWLLKPIVGEFAKAWFFHGIPPWKYTKTAIADLERREAALANREREFAAHIEASEKMLRRAEELENIVIRQRVVIASLTDGRESPD